MTTKPSSKAIILAVISVLVVSIVAILNTVAQSYLYEIKKATAELEAAKASNKAAEAQTLDAINKLKGTENAAISVVTAAQYEAGAIRGAAQRNAIATENAAKTNADALVKATAESVRAENQQFDQVTAPLFSQHTERMAQLNAEIVRLKHEAQAGRDPGTKIVRLPSGRFEEVSILAEREAELEMLKQATTKNWSDLMGMVTGAIGGSLGDVGKLYPNGNESAPARRFIVPEK